MAPILKIKLVSLLAWFFAFKINPYTKHSPLEIEHKDGNYKNNNEENLILLCPNCHSLTSTYKGANLNNGRKSRKKYNS